MSDSNFLVPLLTLYVFLEGEELRYEPFVEPIEVHETRAQEIRLFCLNIGDATAYAWKGRVFDRVSPSTFKPVTKAIRKVHERAKLKGLASFMLDVIIGTPPSDKMQSRFDKPAIFN